MIKAELTREEINDLQKLHYKIMGWEFLLEEMKKERNFWFEYGEYIETVQKALTTCLKKKQRWFSGIQQRLEISNDVHYNWTTDFRSEIVIQQMPNEVNVKLRQRQHGCQKNEVFKKTFMTISPLDCDIVRRLCWKRTAIADYISFLLSHNSAVEGENSDNEIDEFVERLGGSIYDVKCWFSSMAVEHNWKLPCKYTWGIEMISENRLYLQEIYSNAVC